MPTISRLRYGSFVVVSAMLVILCFRVEYSAPSATSLVHDADDQEQTDEGLGDGLYAYWESDGWDILNRDNISPVTAVVIYNARSTKAFSLVEARARIGVLAVQLESLITEIPPGEKVIIPISLGPSLVLGSRQLDYLTYIRASVTLIEDDLSIGPVQLLESRCLAVREEEDRHEVFDIETRDLLYPDGITTEAASMAFHDSLSAMPIDGISEGVGSGIYEFRPVSDHETVDDSQ